MGGGGELRQTIWGGWARVQGDAEVMQDLGGSAWWFRKQVFGL